MSGGYHPDHQVVGRWLLDKDSGNESEPELSTLEFSNLNISPRPLHNRPSRSQSKAAAAAADSTCSLALHHHGELIQLLYRLP